MRLGSLKVPCYSSLANQAISISQNRITEKPAALHLVVNMQSMVTCMRFPPTKLAGFLLTMPRINVFNSILKHNSL